MDIKEQVTQIVEKIKKDSSLAEQFKADPIKAVKSLIGVELPDDAVSKIVEGVKAKLAGDGISGVVSGIKGIFGKK